MAEKDNEKKRYLVVLERSKCIGAAACVAVQPERWILNTEDGKVDLIGGRKKDDGTEEWELSFTDEELEKFLNAAQVCPVNVIHVFDEDGNKLI